MTDKSIPIELNEEQNARFDLITRSLQEVLGGDIIKQKLSKAEQLKCYWGVYFVICCIHNLIIRFYR